MKKFLALLPVFALLTVMMVGCGGEESTEGDGDTGNANTSAAATTVAYCGACGVEAGTETCCSEDAEACGDCEFQEGSALCCTGVAKIEGTYCACGFEKGTENCCAEDAEKCADCGFHEGSTLCCKIKTEDDE